MNTQKYVVVDIETTGHSPAKGDRIIQLAMVTIENGEITDTYTEFINPGRTIPLFIQDLTNITDADVAEAKAFEHYAQTVYEKMQDAIFVAHNTNFDLPFLQAELKRSGLPKWQGLTMDTVELVRLMYPTAFSFKLQDITSELGIPLESAHRADDDAMATALLFLRAKEDLASLPYATLAFLHKRSFQLKSDLSRLFFELTQKKRNAQADDFDRFQGIPLKPRRLFEKGSNPQQSYSRDWREGLEKVFPNFEKRPSQYDMMMSIEEALTQKKELVIEASTGMGKTIGYLLPAVNFALDTGKQVLISTYTTHLQDQLVLKEGKMVEEFIGTPVRISLIKGVSHYIDLARFVELVQGDDESYDETFTIMQVLVWLTATETGDLNEINASSGGQFVLDKIRRSHIRKLGKQEKQADFYEFALKQAQQAHVIVTNHAFLLNQHLSKKSILTNVDAYIWDEAHQVVQAAVSQHEKTFVYTQWKYIFGQIGSLDEQQLAASLFETAKRTGFSTVPEMMKLESLFLKFTALFDEVSSIVATEFATKFAASRHKKNSALLSELSLEDSRFTQMLYYLNEWIDLSQLILQKAERLTEKTIKDQLTIADWRYWTEEMMVKAVEFSEIFVFPLAGEVSWIDGDMRSLPTSLSLYKRPFAVASLVDKVMASARQDKAIIWLSGTMTVPANERFIVNQIGIPNHVPIKKFEPPKDFYRGAHVYIVEDMPDIQSVSQHEYIESVADAVIQTVLVTEGRCFVLFTSQDMLRKTVDLIQDTGLLDEYMLFAQGISSGSRMKLLKSFQRFQKSVLFGTNSFWEGVDVPGDALRAVVVVRLPFTSPEEPIFKARSEVIMREGVNPFLQYALPEAVLRLRQGFGRLIRSKNDKGLFIVLDRRIETKSYGREFISALPEVKVSKVSLEKMVTDIEAWYNKQ
ncbi:ATP-dependent helicase dinG [Planococcus donghaensis MPA1U2]|uniref:3'-5' exonuclease DinG n=1 Tax=Planococcus donghaensis MPA1U2 TaxID=933115 RepID=E7RHF7_9BACL|nr:ATP-dependent DNA helicase DinG [Planococcus donghaensis]EGA89662.1 ATP-dependent helicase dinG [Planococcus donghaensis MPA1U2]